jgi:hypothetical protein
VASSLTGKITNDFTNKYPRTAYATFPNETDRLQLPELNEYLKKYQDPAQADNITKIQKELDDTHAVLRNTMSSLLERGEKIDDLVAKSDGLSAQSKMFYTQVRTYHLRQFAHFADNFPRRKNKTLAALSCEQKPSESVFHTAFTFGLIIDTTHCIRFAYLATHHLTIYSSNRASRTYSAPTST